MIVYLPPPAPPKRSRFRKVVCVFVCFILLIPIAAIATAIGAGAIKVFNRCERLGDRVILWAKRSISS